MQRVAPVRPRPTTAKPITAPVVKATVRPAFRLPFLPVFLLPAAAAVVLALPSVATIMPHQPAEADSVAPKTNESEMEMAVAMSAVATKSVIRTHASATTNTHRKVYSVLRKDIAPD